MHFACYIISMKQFLLHFKCNETLTLIFLFVGDFEFDLFKLMLIILCEFIGLYKYITD